MALERLDVDRHRLEDHAPPRLPPAGHAPGRLDGPARQLGDGPPPRLAPRSAADERERRVRVGAEPVQPVIVPVACGRFGVRSPSRTGTTTAPSLRSAASRSTPSSAATRSTASVQASGRCRPVASAKAATTPAGSAAASTLTAYTVPDVPRPRTWRPTRSCPASPSRRSARYSPDAAERLKAEAHDLEALAGRGCRNDRLDQLVIELILGLR